MFFLYQYNKIIVAQAYFYLRASQLCSGKLANYFKQQSVCGLDGW